MLQDCTKPDSFSERQGKRKKGRVNLNRNIKVEGEGQVARTIMSKVTQRVRGMLTETLLTLLANLPSSLGDIPRGLHRMRQCKHTMGIGTLTSRDYQWNLREIGFSLARFSRPHTTSGYSFIWSPTYLSLSPPCRAVALLGPTWGNSILMPVNRAKVGRKGARKEKSAMRAVR